MFMVDEATAEAIRRAYEDGGEPAGAVEFKRLAQRGRIRASGLRGARKSS